MLGVSLQRSHLLFHCWTRHIFVLQREMSDHYYFEYQCVPKETNAHRVWAKLCIVGAWPLIDFHMYKGVE